MSFFEDLFETLGRRRLGGHHGGRNYGHQDGYNYGHHNKHSYNNHHDPCVQEDYQMYPNTYESMEWPICPQCFSKVQPGAKYCQGCRARVSYEINCPSCGERIQMCASFCTNCGQKVNGAEKGKWK